jgi:RNA polymerase sigma-70 factor (ECF subfamily)
MRPGFPSADCDARSSFPTTHWSVVLSARSLDAPAARAALETLCRLYWYPIYAFIRRQGRNHHEAEDLTQALFARLLEGQGIGRAQPERGRFRTFLLGATVNVLTDEWRRAHAQKRDGGREPVPLEIAGAEQRFAAEPVDLALTPEQAFDRTWALRLIERALDQLREEYAASGRGPLYAIVARHVWGDGTSESQASAAHELGMTEHAFAVAVSRLRQRLRERLRAEVIATVASESEAAHELRHLMSAVQGKSR